MIRFIVGKPGGGKSLYAVRVIIEELLHGSRRIVTNVPLVLEELNAYVQEKYPQHAVDLLSRVRMLTHEETSAFWLVRWPDSVVETIDHQDRKELRWSGNLKGVLFLIDEVHLYFSARNWAKIGAHAFFYLSQHRGLGDDVYLITQHPANVDKQFRSVAEDYILLRNYGKERWFGFSMPSMFGWRKYLDLPSGTTAAVEMGTFRLDVSGLCKCYQTQAKVGIPGSAEADKGKKQRGLPWWLVPGAIAAFILAIFFGMEHFNAFVSGMLTKGLGGAGKAVQSMATNGGPSSVVPAPGRPSAVPPAPVLQPAQPAAAPVSVPSVPTKRVADLEPVEAEEVFVTGLTLQRGRWRVYFSDGGEATYPWRELSDRGRWVEIRPRGGVLERYRWNPPSPAGNQGAVSQSGGGSPVIIGQRTAVNRSIEFAGQPPQD